MSSGATRKIEYLSLERQHAALATELEEAVTRVVRGSERDARAVLAEFEHCLAGYCGTRHAICTACGTDALEIGLSTLNLPKGTEVITAAFGFFSTVAAILRAGLTPVLVDVDARTFNLDPERIRSAVTAYTRVVVPVHLFGGAADLTSITGIASECSLAVIEDAAQALGTIAAGRSAGTIGMLGCLSFNWSKNLATMGNGGALLTDDDELARRARILQNYGMSTLFNHARIGLNSKLDSLEASVLLVKIGQLESWNTRRRAIASRYTALLEDLPEVGTPSTPCGRAHTYHKYTICAEDRDGLREHLAAKGIETLVFYPLPLHQQPCFAGLVRTGPGGVDTAERLARCVISLPIYPELDDEEVEYVASEVRRFYRAS